MRTHRVPQRQTIERMFPAMFVGKCGTDRFSMLAIKTPMKVTITNPLSVSIDIVVR